MKNKIICVAGEYIDTTEVSRLGRLYIPYTHSDLRHTGSSPISIGFNIYFKDGKTKRIEYLVRVDWDLRNWNAGGAQYTKKYLEFIRINLNKIYSFILKNWVGDSTIESVELPRFSSE